MKDTELCKAILGIESPWAVDKVRIDAADRKIEVWVNVPIKTGLFNRVTRAIGAAEVISWRHFNMVGHKVYIHCSSMEFMSESSLPWLGQPGLKLARALARRVVKLLSEGMSYSNVCSILDLELKEIWPIKRALDEGRLMLGGKKVVVEGRSPDAAEESQSEEKTQQDDGLPELDDPVWERLATGELEIQIRPIALRLLVARLRSQLGHINDREGRLVKLNEIRRYFVKHERALTNEISQLHSSVQAVGEA